MEHFQSPRNEGELEHPDAEADGENPICGDRLHFSLRIHGDRIVAARWRAEGCAPVIAAASVTSELLPGMTVSEARAVSRERVVEALGGLPARKAHAAVLVSSVLRKALEGTPNPSES
jgi:nitrogen fixation NifU-like protein